MEHLWKLLNRVRLGRQSMMPYTAVSVCTPNHTPPRKPALDASSERGQHISNIRSVAQIGLRVRHTCHALPAWGASVRTPGGDGLQPLRLGIEGPVSAPIAAGGLRDLPEHGFTGVLDARSEVQQAIAASVASTNGLNGRPIMGDCRLRGSRIGGAEHLRTIIIEYAFR